MIAVAEQGKTGAASTQYSIPGKTGYATEHKKHYRTLGSTGKTGP